MGDCKLDLGVGWGGYGCFLIIGNWLCDNLERRRIEYVCGCRGCCEECEGISKDVKEFFYKWDFWKCVGVFEMN